MIYYLEHAYHGAIQQIAAIGKVEHTDLSGALVRIERAENAVAALMEKLHLADADAQDYVKYYFLLIPNIFLLEDARLAYKACLDEVQRGIAVSLTASEQQIAAGDTVRITYTVRNKSDAAACYSYRMTYPKLAATCRCSSYRLSLPVFHYVHGTVLTSPFLPKICVPSDLEHAEMERFPLKMYQLEDRY